MPYDPRKRDNTWQMIQPGCWIDPAGVAHIFPQEGIAELQRQHPEVGFDVMSREDYDLFVEVVTREIRKLFPEMRLRFVQHEVVKH